MKIKVILLGILFTCSIGIHSFAQVGGFVKNRVTNATNRAQQQTGKEVDKKVNNAIDEGISNIFNKKKGEKDQPAPNQSEPAVQQQSTEPASSTSSGSRSGSNAAANEMMGKAILGSMGISMERPANIKNSYDYSGNIIMVVQEWNDNGETDGEVLYTTHYTNDNKGYAMDFKSKEKGNSRIIFDNDNKVMILMGDNGTDKTGMVFGTNYSDSVSSTSNTASPSDYYTSFKKSGKSKTIAGYSCDEYVYEDNEYKASYWLTNDLPADLWAKMFNANTVASIYAGRPQGFIMEWSNEEKNTKEKTYMIVKEVNKNQPTSVSTMGYTFISYKGAPGTVK